MNNSQHCPGHEDENKKSVTLENLLNIDNGKVLERFKLHQQKKLDNFDEAYCEYNIVELKKACQDTLLIIEEMEQKFDSQYELIKKYKNFEVLDQKMNGLYKIISENFEKDNLNSLIESYIKDEIMIHEETTDFLIKLTKEFTDIIQSKKQPNTRNNSNTSKLKPWKGGDPIVVPTLATVGIGLALVARIICQKETQYVYKQIYCCIFGAVYNALAFITVGANPSLWPAILLLKCLHGTFTKKDEPFKIASNWGTSCMNLKDDDKKNDDNDNDDDNDASATTATTETYTATPDTPTVIPDTPTDIPKFFPNNGGRKKSRRRKITKRNRSKKNKKTKGRK